MYEFSKHVVPHIEDLTRSLGDVLSRVNLPALPGQGSLGGGPEPSAAPLVQPAEAADPAADAGGGGGGAAPAATPAAPAAPGRRPPPSRARTRAAGRRRQGGHARPAPPELAERDAEKAPEKERAGGDGLRTGAPDGSELAKGRAGSSRPRAGRRRPRRRPRHRRSRPRARRRSIRRSWVRTGRAGGRTPRRGRCWPTRTSCSTTSGCPTSRRARSTRGSSAVLTKLSQEHKITVSCMCSDHSKFTAGGSISNHAFGRGLDIAVDRRRDRQPRPAPWPARSPQSSPTSTPRIRPDEIGSPFAINGPGYFTDADHKTTSTSGSSRRSPPTSSCSPTARWRRPAAGRRPSRTRPGAGTPGAGRAGRGERVRGSSLGDGGAADRADPARGPRDRWRNTGPQVNDYLAAAGSVAWEPVVRLVHDLGAGEAGHKMPGSGWAAVATWVRNAEQGSNGLQAS